VRSKLNKTKSLQGDLSRWLIGITLLGSLLAGIVSGWIAFQESRDQQDDLLKHIARLLPAEDDDNPFRRGFRFDDNDDADIVVEVLRSRPSPRLGLTRELPMNRPLTRELRGDSWRIYATTVRDDDDRTTYVVAQQTELRDEFAIASALMATIPVISLALLLLLAIHFILRHRLKPVKQLAAQLDQRDEQELKAINTNALPIEIIPFVEAINRLLQRVETSMARQKRFIADAAHELRTPVTALSLLAENIDNTTDPESRQQHRALLKQGLLRLQRLVEQLLNLARLQADFSQASRPVAVDQLIRELVADLYLLAEAKTIDLGIEQLDAVVILDQEDALRHIIQNAISNAIAYTPEHGCINIRLSANASTLLFSVTDNGPGIADDLLDKVITPFYRNEQNGNVGHGLGLSIAREAAKRLGGQIRLSNRESGGLCFEFSLPKHLSRSYQGR